MVDATRHTQTNKTFDKYNRLFQETLNNGLTLEYRYDLSGKLIQTILPDRSSMEFSHENLFLKKINRTDNNGKILYTHSYDIFDLSGNATSATLIGKTGKMKYAIDIAGRISSIESELWSGSIQDYDPCGNVIKKSARDELGNYVSESEYDDLNQILNETGDFKETYSCDSLYNRTKKGSADYSLNNLNQLLSDGKNEYIYDLNGCLIQIKNEGLETTFKYDALNRLIKVIKVDQSFGLYLR